MLSTVASYAQKIDTIVYNVIYRDTVIYNIKTQSIDENSIDLSNWGIGPYAGIDYTFSQQYGNGFSYSFGFGLSYYIWKLPKLKLRRNEANNRKRATK